jgi:hypothetical protein
VVTPKRTIRSLVALGLAAGLIVAACGSSAATLNLSNLGLPGASTGANGGNGGGSSLTSGLSANLDKLTSYKFTESIAGASSTETAADTGSFLISGTVINQPTKAMLINDLGIQFIVIGAQGWTSLDGTTWMTTDPTSSSLTDLLPGNDYAQWFDTYSTGFTVAGDETKNGVQCVHYKGNNSLGGILSGVSGVSANFQADLWVAKDGNYPVSGVFGYTASAGGQSGSFGYSFDVTNVNDPSNSVTAPTNVMAVPS